MKNKRLSAQETLLLGLQICQQPNFQWQKLGALEVEMFQMTRGRVEEVVEPLAQGRTTATDFFACRGGLFSFATCDMWVCMAQGPKRSPFGERKHQQTQWPPVVWRHLARLKGYYCYYCILLSSRPNLSSSRAEFRRSWEILSP